MRPKKMTLARVDTANELRQNKVKCEGSVRIWNQLTDDGNRCRESFRDAVRFPHNLVIKQRRGICQYQDREIWELVEPDAPLQRAALQAPD